MSGVKITKFSGKAKCFDREEIAFDAVSQGKIKEGDVVVLPTMGFTKLHFDGNEYYIGPENQILAKIIND